jgi:hypothetical protein
VPDSLTALGILALVGLPGFVYMQLRSAGEEDPSQPSALDTNLATVFFGLVCAAAGVTLSLGSQQERWVDVLVQMQAGEDPTSLSSSLVDNAPEIASVSILGALLFAVLFAGVIRALRLVAKNRRKKGKKQLSEARTVGLLLGFGVVGLVGVGIWPWF